MTDQQVTVLYSWTAKPGKLDDLVNIYKQVSQAMEQNEPGAMEVQCYVSEADSTLYVRDEFQDAGAVGFHLGTTAANHFGSLLEIATPGRFHFLGNVTDEIKAGTQQMGLDAVFSAREFGYSR